MVTSMEGSMSEWLSVHRPVAGPNREAARVLVVATALVAVLIAARAATAYEVAAVSDGGSVKGKVVFTGGLPDKKKIVPTKDREVCGTGVREVDQITVAPDKGVFDAIVYLKTVEKGKAWPKPPKPPEIDNVKCDFVPHVQVVQPGDFAIVNSDPVLHNTKGFLDKTPVFNLALPNQGQRITRALKRSGLMRVECDAHGWMLGWVHVAENPYYATTAKDGTFTIGEIPPGSYTLVAWHEFTGPVEVPVTVKAKEPAAVTVELKK
jgi:Polysaccharide lyase family 4, domain II